MAHTSGFISLAFSNGLVSRLTTIRQVGETLHFRAEGTTPGKPKIVHEGTHPEAIVGKVLTELATLSPKKSPRGNDAANLLGDFGYHIPERDEDPPEPKKEDESVTTATDMKLDPE